jgi:hypothetical protein
VPTKGPTFPCFILPVARARFSIACADGRQNFNKDIVKRILLVIRYGDEDGLIRTTASLHGSEENL